MQIANKVALKFMMWESYCTFVMDVGFVESFVICAYLCNIYLFSDWKKIDPCHQVPSLTILDMVLNISDFI